MPDLAGLTRCGERTLGAAVVVARKQRLITHPRLSVTKALYPEPVVRDAVLRLWDERLAGADLGWDVERRVTLESWLRQVGKRSLSPGRRRAGCAEAGT